MFIDAFDEVDWPQVHRTLHEEVPRLFQLWTCKQVMNIAATNKNLRRRHRDGRSDKCSCCTIHVETADHVLLCPEVGRVEAFQLCMTALERWLDEADTDPDLTDSIVEYVRRRGGGNN
jgi:Fe2+ or Zn2+ uptake regulation protein